MSLLPYLFFACVYCLIIATYTCTARRTVLDVRNFVISYFSELKSVDGTLWPVRDRIADVVVSTAGCELGKQIVNP